MECVNKVCQYVCQQHVLLAGYINNTCCQQSRTYYLLDDVQRIVGLPPPIRAHRILMVSPTEHTFVGTGETGGGLHALVRSDP